MQRGSSVHFKPVKSAVHAVSHADRTISPTYLLSPDKSLGTVVVLDDEGRVASTLQQKLALASRQALRSNDYSPLWEGVINLRRPEEGEEQEAYKKECTDAIKDWCLKYEDMTGHKVLRADVHLDEGHIDDGKVLLNAHAHVICDKTNELGRVLKLTPQKLRELQTITAAVTRLERGVNSRMSGVKHLGHQAYRHLAEKGRLEVKQHVTQAVNKTKGENFQRTEAQIAEVKAKLEEQYKADRAALKASGEAKQADYQALKKVHELALAELVATKEKVASLTEYTGKLEAATLAAAENRQVLEAKLEAQADQFDKLKADAMAVITPLRTEVKTMKTQITKLTQENAKLEADKAKFATIRTNYQADKAAGQRPAEIVPDPAPRAIEQPKTGLEGIFSPGIGNSIFKPKKTLQEALKGSWDAMVQWIKGVGVHVPIDTSLNQTHSGQVVHLDELHAVQRTGPGRFGIHELTKLDRIPHLDDPKIEIKYQNGKGTVKDGPARTPKLR